MVNASLKTNLHVAGHLGVKLPATPPPHGALDDEELFIIEEPSMTKNSSSSRARKIRAPQDTTPLGGVRKMDQTRLQLVIELCR